MSDHNSTAPSTNPFITFHFESLDLRIEIGPDDEPWFCAKDACEILDISKYRDAVSGLDEDERVSMKTDTLGGKQEMIFVSESGLYALIFNSTKPEARRFRKWVTQEVLPSIRKMGYYGTMTSGQQIALRNQKIKLVKELNSKDAFAFETALTSLRIVCHQLGEPMPDIALIGQDRTQQRLPGL